MSSVPIFLSDEPIKATPCNPKKPLVGPTKTFSQELANALHALTKEYDFFVLQ